MPGKTIGNIDFSADSLQAVKLWQYNDAERLNALLDGEIAFAKKNITGFWQNWFDDVFNIDTANNYGLTLWGQILGVRRISYTDPDTETEVVVSDDMYRRMLKARAFSFGCDGTIPDINKFLQIIFPGKPVFIRDNYNMSVTVVAYFEMTAEERAVLLSLDFLPIPCGVKSNIVIIDKTFGYKNSDLEPFDQGTFIQFG